MSAEPVSQQVEPAAQEHSGSRTTTARLLGWAIDGVESIVGLGLAAMTILVLANVATRTFFGWSILWLPDVEELCLGLITFVGAASAYGRGQHPAMLALVDRLPERIRKYHPAAVDWVVIAATGAILSGAIPLIQIKWSQPTPILGISQGWAIVIICVGAVALILIGLLRVADAGWRAAVVTGVPVLAVTFAISQTEGQWSAWMSSNMLTAMLIILVVLVIAGIPISFVLVIDASLAIIGSGGIAFNALPGAMNDGVSLNPILLAIPFFIFAGFIMDSGGLAKRLLGFLVHLLGRLPGGIKHVLVVGMVIVSGMSGSKAADMTAVGTPLRRTVIDSGTSAEEMTAILAASSSMGETIPPSIPLLAVGSITTLSVGALFIAGIVPALLLAACLIALIAIRSRNDRANRPAAVPRRQLAKELLQALVPGAMPLLLIIGVAAGIATPEEVAAVAVLYGIIAGIAYRELRVGTIWRSVKDTASMTGMIMFITAAAAAFSWVLTTQDLQQTITSALEKIPGGKVGFILVSCVLLAVMGMLFEGLPAVFVFTPLVLPASQAIGINGLQYGIVLIIALGIGAFAPPIGIGFYVACGIGKVRPEKVFRNYLPYFVALFVGLLIIGLVPDITLWLPHLFNYK
jgi:tripartite ATP-independent transporter DctM subunit